MYYVFHPPADAGGTILCNVRRDFVLEAFGIPRPNRSGTPDVATGGVFLKNARWARLIHQKKE